VVVGMGVGGGGGGVMVRWWWVWAAGCVWWGGEGMVGVGRREGGSRVVVQWSEVQWWCSSRWVMCGGVVVGWLW